MKKLKNIKDQSESHICYKKNNLVTKTYLNQELKLLEMRIALKFDDFAGRIDENAKKYRDQVLTPLMIR